MEKRTKIIATVSDRRCGVEFIRSLYEAGMNCVRINSAHVTTESATAIVNSVREVSGNIGIIVDTKGPEIRVTAMDESNAKGLKVKRGQKLRIAGTSDNLLSGRDMLYVNDPDFAADIPTGSSILIDDGEVELAVVDKVGGYITVEVRNDGVIGSRKSVNVPGVPIDLPSITERDRQFILWAIEQNIDFIAHSFVRKVEDVLAVKSILKAHNSPIRVISKIENREGIDNLDSILRETYGVMVARGDLGIEIPAEQIPVVQRHIVRRCIESKTPVIIATQMLHTMISNPRPTRAEVTDVANAVFERVDAIMLSGETANGDYPVESVATMARIAREIERDNDHHRPFTDMNMVHINNEITVQLARSAVGASVNLPVRAIICDSLTGRTGRYLSAFRGGVPVYAVCYRKSAMRQLSISYGVYAMSQEPAEDHNGFLRNILDELLLKEWLRREDLVVVIGGSFGAAKGASFMEIGTVLNFENKANS